MAEVEFCFAFLTLVAAQDQALGQYEAEMTNLNDQGVDLLLKEYRTITTSGPMNRLLPGPAQSCPSEVPIRLTR